MKRCGNTLLSDQVFVQLVLWVMAGRMTMQLLSGPLLQLME